MNPDSCILKSLSPSPCATTTINNSGQSSFVWISRSSYFRINEKELLNDIDDSPTMPADKKLYSWSICWFDPSHQHILFHGHSNHDEVIFPCPRSDKNMNSALKKLSIIDVNVPNKSSIILMKLSLDKQLLAIQCSLTTIVVLDIESRRQWTIVIKTSTDMDNVNRILSDGLIWSEHGGNSQDLIIVTTKGLELYKISPIRVQCKLSRTISMNCYAFWYEPNHRLLLVSTMISSHRRTSSSPSPLSSPSDSSAHSTPSNSSKLLHQQLCGIFFRTDKVDHIMKLELPPPEKSPKFDIIHAMSKDNISIVSLYGDPYCISLQRIMDDDYLVLHHVTKTAVTRTHVMVLPCPNASLKVSVVDNILLCHCQHINRVVLYDINATASSVRKIDGLYGDVTYALLPLTPPSEILLEPSLSSSDITHHHHVITPAKQTSHEKSATYMSEVGFHNTGTNRIWQAFSPAWAWNSDNQSMWRIKLNIYAISSVIHDPKKSIAFLMKRSQSFQAPRHAYHTSYDHEQSQLAKQLIIARVNSCLEKRLGLSWLEALFQVMIIPYARYQLHPISSSRIISHDIISSSAAANILDDDVSVKTAKANDAMKRTSSKKPMSLAASLAAFGYGVVSGQLLAGGGGTSSPSSSYNNNMSNSNTSSPASSSRAVDSVSNISPDKQKSLAAPKDNIEPIETSAAMQMFLSDILSINTSPSSPSSSSSSARDDKDNADGNMNSSANNTLSSYKIPTRRSIDGDIVISQLECLSEVWLPTAMCCRHNKANSDSILSLQQREYSEWSLSIYMATLHAEGVSPHPALALLHLQLLAFQEKYIQIAKFLQMRYYPDAIEIAMAILELADVIQDTSSKMKPATTIVNGDKANKKSGLQRKRIDSAIRLLQEQGVDMLWRLHECTIAVRWMLGHHQIIEAMSLCLELVKDKSNNLTSSSISAVEFFTSAIAKLKQLDDQPKATIEVDVEDMVDNTGIKVEIMQHTFNFIKDWEPTVLSLLPSGRSRLASQCQFPMNMFDIYNSSRFKELFGFASTMIDNIHV